MEKLLYRKAQEYRINPDITELTETQLLCIDSKLKSLLIITRKNKESKLISLVDIDKCDLKTVQREHLPGKYQIIELVLFHKTINVPPIEIIFYNKEDEISSQAEER